MENLDAARESHLGDNVDDNAGGSEESVGNDIEESGVNDISNASDGVEDCILSLKQITISYRFEQIDKPSNILWDPEAFVKALINYASTVDPVKWKVLFSDELLEKFDESNFGVDALIGFYETNLPRAENAPPPKINSGTNIPRPKAIKKIRNRLTKPPVGKRDSGAFGDLTAAIFVKLFDALHKQPVSDKTRRSILGDKIVDAYLAHKKRFSSNVIWSRRIVFPDSVLLNCPNFVGALNAAYSDLIYQATAYNTEDENDGEAVSYFPEGSGKAVKPIWNENIQGSYDECLTEFKSKIEKELQGVQDLKQSIKRVSKEIGLAKRSFKKVVGERQKAEENKFVEAQMRLICPQDNAFSEFMKPILVTARHLFNGWKNNGSVGTFMDHVQNVLPDVKQLQVPMFVFNPPPPMVNHKDKTKSQAVQHKRVKTVETPLDNDVAGRSEQEKGTNASPSDAQIIVTLDYSGKVVEVGTESNKGPNPAGRDSEIVNNIDVEMVSVEANGAGDAEVVPVTIEEIAAVASSSPGNVEIPMETDSGVSVVSQMVPVGNVKPKRARFRMRN